MPEPLSHGWPECAWSTTPALPAFAMRPSSYRLRDAAPAGAAVVVHASDLDEVLALADEMLVVYDGSVRCAPADRRVVGRLMLGAES